MENGTNVTMYDYILEEEKVLSDILIRQKETAGEFAGMFKEKRPKEIVLCGSGTSCHAAMAARQFWEKILGIRVRAEYASAFKELQEIYDKDMLLIGISQGGQSRSTIEALKKGRERGIPTVGISENRKAELFRYSDLCILMECGEELSVAKTKGYIASMGILFVMALQAGEAAGLITGEEKAGYERRMKKTAKNFPNIIKGSKEWLLRNREELVKARRIIVVGYEKNCATVMEGALKMLETMRYGINGYELEEFCHGIYNSVDENTYLFYLGARGEDREKILRLREVIGQTTRHQFLITGTADGFRAGTRDCILPFTDDEYFSVLEYIIPMQVTASMLPYELGINPFMARDPMFHRKMGSKLA